MTNILREMRLRSGLSVNELAELAVLSPGTIYKIEQAKTSNPSKKTHIGVAEAIAKALDTEVSHLFRPSQLTDLGRPPHTGGKYTRNSSDDGIYGVLCNECNLYYPAQAGCETCG